MHIFVITNSSAFSVMMGPTEIPAQSAETIKIPTAHYEFGANFIDPQVCCVLLFIPIFTYSSASWAYLELCFFLAVDAFREGYDRWQTKCKTKMRFD